MKFALVNPAWTFEGSTYFGCQEPHYPLELLFAFDQIKAAGHEPLLVDAQLEKLDTVQVRAMLDGFGSDFLADSISRRFSGRPYRAVLSILALSAAGIACSAEVVC